MSIPKDTGCKHREGLEVLRDGFGTYWLTCANPKCRQLLRAVSEKYTDKQRGN